MFALALGRCTAEATGLNGTGQTQCYNAADGPAACRAAVGGEAGVLPRQDARYGRDPQAASAAGFGKVGAGDAGFDFSKIANNGTTLAVTAALGGNPTDWACTKDNVTGLIWEVKITSGLRNSAHTYTWYSTDVTQNGGSTGALGSNTCGGSLAAAAYNGQCSTQSFVAAVNAAGLCGATDWRLPTRRELLPIVNAGRASPSMDSIYFANTVSTDHWTASTYTAEPTFAWLVYFDFGRTYAFSKTGGKGVVRLVRGGQAFDAVAASAPADTVAPDTRITKPPASSTATTASINFTGTDNVGVTGFECSLDGAAVAACASPVNLTGLSLGSHTFQVCAKDAAGNVDATPASATWNVQAAPVVPAPAVGVPTLGGWATLLLMLGVMGVAGRGRKRC